MTAKSRKQTAFRCDREALIEFQARLTKKEIDMSPVIEGWIMQFLEGKLALPANAAQPGDAEPPKTGDETITQSGDRKNETLGLVPSPNRDIDYGEQTNHGAGITNKTAAEPHIVGGVDLIRAVEKGFENMRKVLKQDIKELAGGGKGTGGLGRKHSRKTRKRG